MGIHPVFSHFGAETIIRQNDRNCFFNLKMQQGYGTADVYSVLPGVEFIFFDLHSKCYTPMPGFRHNIIEINYCRNGRMECVAKDGHLLYFGEGDLYFLPESNHSQTLGLPLGFYQGVAIIVDLNRLSSWTKVLLPDIPIDVSSLIQRLLVDNNCYCIQANEEIRNFFEDLFLVPEEAKVSYLRLKVQELFIFLHYFDVSKEKPKKSYERQQVAIVKDIHKRIMEEVTRRFTVEELSKEYFISPTALRLNFKGVYGVSIHAYMKEVRIKKAAELLKKTDMDFTEITNAVGYKSQSKLGAAFKSVMKMTPLEYRKAYERKT